MLVVLGLFRVFKALETWCYALIFCNSAITFLIALALYKIVGVGVLYLLIRGYTSNTKSIRIRPSGLAKSLIALKAICNTIVLLILAISLVIIV